MNKKITIEFCVWLQRNFDAIIAEVSEKALREKALAIAYGVRP